MEKLGSKFLFHFTHPEDRDHIARFGAKVINGALLLLTKWRHNTCIRDYKIEEEHFWVEINGLPLEYFEDRRLISDLFNVIG